MDRAVLLDTPLGPMLAADNGRGLSRLDFFEELPGGFVMEETPLLKVCREQVAEYFAGTRRAFDLPLSPQGTPFQLRVWEALRAIPYGETRSYAQIAAAIGRPRASRAVGGANHRNPISLIQPCHRVIGADGSLTGYGGGIARKQALLELERRQG